MDPRSLVFATVLTIGVTLVAPLPATGGRSRRPLNPHPQAATEMQSNLMQLKGIFDQSRSRLRHSRSTNDYVSKNSDFTRNSMTSRHKRDLRDLYEEYMDDASVHDKQKLAFMVDYLNYLRSLRLQGGDEEYDINLGKRQPPVGFHAVRGKRSVHADQ